MKQFILFYQVRLDGKLSPLLGSDSCLPIDGRLGKARAYQQAREQAHSLRHVKPGIVAFQLHRGSIRNNRPAGEIHAVSKEVASKVSEACRIGIVAW